MRLPPECYQMMQTIQHYMPHLEHSQIKGLTLWVYGTILAKSSCQNAVVLSLVGIVGNWNSLRQYLREWLYDGTDRASPCRVQLDVKLCFVPLFRWLLSWWQSDKLVLAIDPTTKGDQTTSIVISVVYRSCAIPIAWHILPANKPGEWIAPTVSLLKLLSEADTGDMTVLVMYDRGLRSPRLWEQIRSVGWHPYARQIDQHRVLSRWRNSPARAVSRTGTRPRIYWGRDGIQEHEQTPSWNDDRGLG